MKRREFIKLIGSVAASWPFAARAQQQNMPVIGMLVTTMKHAARFLDNVRQGLAEHGYFDGKNYRFEFRETNFQAGVGRMLFRELIDQKVTLIIVATTSAVRTVSELTQTIPVVFTIASDPVENGFVSSLNRPGGNITGIFNLGVTLAGKRLEVLRELLPSATKFAFLSDPGNIVLGKIQTQAIEAARSRLGLEVLHVNARTPEELDAAFETAVREGADGMIVGADVLFAGGNVPTLVAAAARYRLPTIYVDESPVRAGGLINYGTDQRDSDRMVGRYAGRILKGEKPADMPVELSTRTVMIVNLKTANSLGITVPQTLLARADEVIE